MKPSEVLRAARALIADPKHWTQRTLARDRDGNAVAPSAEEAAQFCAIGALGRVEFANRIPEPVEARTILDVAAHCWNQLDAICANDRTSHEVVLQMFDHATARAEQRESGQ